MFYTVGHFYRIFNREKEVSGNYKLTENHPDYLVIHGIKILKDNILEEDSFEAAHEIANEHEKLWAVYPLGPQTPPRKTPKTSKTRGNLRKSKKTRKNRK
jgi:hypothetical protein